MTVSCSFPAAGTVRTTDERVINLYQKAVQYDKQPCLWEGLFRLACLIKTKPMDEPVAAYILHAIEDSENGALSGTFSEQICIARAAFALFEYNTDREILKRIASWLRYVEIEFDNLIRQDHILYHPADLMELLVRFYQASGVKSALRISARLRADAFDWTTALHTFQQTIPVCTDDQKEEQPFPDKDPAEIEFDEKERLINHAETLADGVRYTIYAGIYSGHKQDLSAGKTVWKHLLKHHHALCGGTTGSPYLCGNAADRPVFNTVPAAWTEAFAAVMAMPDSEWALDEMIRIVFNALDECLNRPEHASQRINSVSIPNRSSDDISHLYARMTRAVAAAYHHAVALSENGIRIQYPIHGRYMIMARKQPLILIMDPDSVVFQCKKPVSVNIDFYLSAISTSSIRVIRNSDITEELNGISAGSTGIMIHMDTEWHNRDEIRLVPEDRTTVEETHHQGCAYFASNRLLCVPSDPETFACAVCRDPERAEGEFIIYTAPVEKWKLRDNQPGDIPVLPEIRGHAEQKRMQYYADVPCRISMFPRAR